MEISLTFSNCDKSCPDDDKCDESYSRNCGTIIVMSHDMFPIIKKIFAGMEGLYDASYADSNDFLLSESFVKSFNVNKELISSFLVDNKSFNDELIALKTFFKRARTLKRRVVLEIFWSNPLWIPY